MSRASVSRGNNSNCFHGKQCWPSLAYISLADSKSVRRVARVTARFREPRGGPSSALAALGTLQPGPPRLSKTRSYPCSASNLYIVSSNRRLTTQPNILGLDSGPNARQARFQPDIHPDSCATGATRLTSATESRLRLFAGESLPTFDLDSGSGVRAASRVHGTL